MKILQKIREKSKAILGLILSAAVITSTFGVAGVAYADGPKFNNMDGDWQLLQGANRTTNQTNWNDPISGTAGDTFAGMIYYHNTMLNTTANNVRIKLNIPAQTTNKVGVLSASISADNAATVTDTIIDGKVYGKSGLTVNMDQESKLTLVPGSIKWFAEGNTATNATLPNGQSGDEIITSTGINLGNIQGCWEHIGYVTFLFTTTSVAQANVSVNKTVRNVTIGETAYVKSNYAKPGDILEYDVLVSNTGDGTAKNLYMTDAIPAGVTYISGSTTVGGVVVANGITGDGISLGDLAAGKTLDVRFRVTVGQTVTNGATLTNTAYLHFNKEKLPSTASTIVKFGVVTPPIGGELPITGGENTILTILTVIAGSLAGVYAKYRNLLAAKIW